MQGIAFWTFASFAIIAALLVIFSKNPVQAVLSLILVFLSTAVTWLMLDAEFLAITLILVYVGAVMVLFLFVVMMLDIRSSKLKSRFSFWTFTSILLTASLFTTLIFIINKAKTVAPTSKVLLSYGPSLSNTELLGMQIFTRYLLQFEIAGVLLLVAIIAAISLIYRGPQARKVQKIADQTKVKPNDRIRLV